MNKLFDAVYDMLRSSRIDSLSHVAFSDTAASSQQSTEGSFPTPDVLLSSGPDTAPDSGPVSVGSTYDGAQSPLRLAAGAREPTDVNADPENGAAAQPEKAPVGGDTNDSKAAKSPPEDPASATTSSKSAKRKPQASAAAPSLPPFFKDAPASKGAATAAPQPTSYAPDEVNATEVVDNTQISGVGFADKTNVPSSGCKCVVM